MPLPLWATFAVFALAVSEFASSSGAPMILLKNLSGEGTLLDAGIEATHADKKRGSVVGFVSSEIWSASD